MLNGFLTSISFNNTHADASLYVKHENDEAIIIVFYLEDLLLTEKTLLKMKHVGDHLCSRFGFRILDVKSNFLRKVVEDGQNGVTIHNIRAIEKILKHFGVECCNSVLVLFPNGFSNQGYPGKPLSNLNSYKKSIGSLMNLSKTNRPDICYATKCLARFLNKTTEVH